MTRLVLFDIDGTLIHTHGVGVKAFFDTLKSEFRVEDSPEKYSFAGRTDRALVQEIFEQHGIKATEENFQRFFDTYVMWLDYRLRRSMGELTPGSDHFICSLLNHPNPPTIGLLTGNIRLGAEIKLRHFYLWDYFQLGAFGDESSNRNVLAKLALERGRKMLGRALKPEEVVVVGDTILDIACADAIGARCLAVCTGGSTFDELAERNTTWLAHNFCKIQSRVIL